MKETPLMEWVNSESNGLERQHRKEMEERILQILLLPPGQASPQAIAHVFAMAIAEYVLELSLKS